MSSRYDDERPVILLLFANDRHKPLALEKEREQLVTALEQLQGAGQLEVRPRDAATKEDLITELRDRGTLGRIRVVHFSGHGSGTALSFEDEQGGRDPGRATALAEILGQQEGLVLVFLNACSTAPQIELLRSAGVKAVVGTSHDVGDRTAQEFAAEFYRYLGEGGALRPAFDATSANFGFRAKPGDERDLDEHDPMAGDEPPSSSDGASSSRSRCPWTLACDGAFEEWRLVREDDLLARLAKALTNAFTPAEFHRWLLRWLEHEPQELPAGALRSNVLSPSIHADLQALARHHRLTRAFFDALLERVRFDPEGIERLAFAWTCKKRGTGGSPPEVRT